MYARRDVLRAGATLGLLAASPWLHAAAPAGLLTRKIPSTGEALPVIGAGTSDSFEVQAGSAQYQQLKVVLQAFFEGGARVIDTSPNYGGADSILGQLLEEGGWHLHRHLGVPAAIRLAGLQGTAQAYPAVHLRFRCQQLVAVHRPVRRGQRPRTSSTPWSIALAMPSVAGWGGDRPARTAPGATDKRAKYTVAAYLTPPVRTLRNKTNPLIWANSEQVYGKGAVHSEVI